MKKQFLFGLHAVKAALKNPQRKHTALYVTDKSHKTALAFKGTLPSVKVISLKELEQKIPSQSIHQQVVLETTPIAPFSLEDICAQAKNDATIVVLDQVTDPHNVGAILRSCAAFGSIALVVTANHGADTSSAVLAKVASGALEVVPILEEVNLSQTMDTLKEYGFWCYGLDEEGEETLGKIKLDGKVALFFGAEGPGLRRLTKEKCDVMLRLPTTDQFSTLNVSNTVAVALFATR